MGHPAGRNRLSHTALVLSDLHLKEKGLDARYPLFLEVISKFEQSSLDELILMGDIFDILIGPKKFWLHIHPEFFEIIQRIISKNKKVTWVQGNHDFQLGALLKPLGIHWVEESEVLERENCKIFISHGDLADWSDKLHPVWRAFLTSKFLSFFIWLIPSRFGEKVLYPWTVKLSRASRKMSHKRAVAREERARIIFRNYADKKAKTYGCDLVLLGHSHISDDYELNPHSKYLNFGSWFEEPAVGILQIDGNKLKSKVFKAAAWHPDTST